MCEKLYIIGAGGHGKVIADIAVKCGYTDIAFLDDSAIGDCLGFSIVGTSADIEKLNNHAEFVIAVGNNSIRKRIAETHAVKWATLIHPSAQIGLKVRIGEGSVIMAGAAVNPCACVGKHCILNTHSVVEHDNVLGDYVHISPKAALGGTVVIGDCTHVGIGASLKNNINICSGCVIGAGTVVVNDITESGTYVGVPARMIKKD